MKTQTGLIFKPERPRVGPTEFYAQYREREAQMAARVSAMSADAVFEDPTSPWVELRDTITNYPVRYRKGREIKQRIKPSRSFLWEQRRGKITIVNVIVMLPDHSRSGSARLTKNDISVATLATCK